MDQNAFQMPKRLEYTAKTLTPTYGEFFAQPFEKGWGTTIGNALRRVLLSSVEGAAISALRIEGVLHEFTSIPGVYEEASLIPDVWGEVGPSRLANQEMRRRIWNMA